MSGKTNKHTAVNADRMNIPGQRLAGGLEVGSNNHKGRPIRRPLLFEPLQN
jgi:hypothetical protein